jgi:hypothetical protein
MSPETEAKLARVKKYSTSLRRVFNFFAFMAFCGMPLSLLIVLTRGTSDASATMAVFDRVFSGDEITWTLKLLVSIWALFVFGVALKLLRHLAGLFDLYAQGKIFTADNVYQIRQIGVSVFLFLATGVYALLAKLLLLALDHPLGAAANPDSQTIGPDLDTAMTQILGGTIIIVVSWIMDVGREMREEQDLTV